MVRMPGSCGPDITGFEDQKDQDHKGEAKEGQASSDRHSSTQDQLAGGSSKAEIKKEGRSQVESADIEEKSVPIPPLHKKNRSASAKTRSSQDRAPQKQEPGSSPLFAEFEALVHKDPVIKLLGITYPSRLK